MDSLSSASGASFTKLTFMSFVHKNNVAVMQRKAAPAEVLRRGTLHVDRSKKTKKKQLYKHDSDSLKIRNSHG